MASIGSSFWKDVWQQVLQIGSGNVGLTNSPQVIQDGAGNSSPLGLSTTNVQINGYNIVLTNTSSIEGTNTGDQTIALTGDVTGSGTGSFAATIGNNAVTYAKMQQISANTLLGSNSGSTANITEVTIGSGLALSGGVLSSTTSGAISVLNVQRFTSSGPFTYTPTSGMKYVKVTLVAGGGGSGGLSNAGNFGATIGASAGGVLIFLLSASDVGSSLSGNVGAAGTAGSAGNNDGGNGGNTTLSTTVGWVASGGTKGTGAAGGTTSANNSNTPNANSVGTGTLILNQLGMVGGSARASSSLAISGFGGSCLFGIGGHSQTAIPNAVLAGIAGTSYGAGASGVAACAGSGNNVAGAAGGIGIAIFEEYI